MSNFDHFIGTRAVSGQHAFDTAALSAWLEKNLEGFAGPLSVEMFKGGQSNPTYKLITPGQSYVMRAKPGPVAKLLPSAHAIEREFAVMSGLQGTDVPVPRMYVLCEDESVIGRAFYVMEFMQGRVLWDQSLPGMTPAERTAIYNESNRVIAALHTVKFAERGLASYGKPGNYFERQIGRWSKQYVASITQPIEEMDKLMAWLPAHMPASARAPWAVQPQVMRSIRRAGRASPGRSAGAAVDVAQAGTALAEAPRAASASHWRRLMESSFIVSPRYGLMCIQNPLRMMQGPT